MTATTAGHARADALLRAAQDTTYRWPVGFAGFTARLRVGVVSAAVTVRSPGDVVIENAADAASSRWAHREISSMVGHRWPSDYDAADGRWDKTVDPADGHPAGRLVHLSGDPFSSSYRVGDGLVSEVHRTMGNTRFSIVILARTPAPDGRWLSSAFSVYYWCRPDGGVAEVLEKVQSFQDSYVEVDGVCLPSGRRITTGDASGLSSRAFSLAAHRLLG